MEKVKEEKIFVERFLQVEIVGDVAILRELSAGMPPKCLISGSKSIVAKELANILR